MRKNQNNGHNNRNNRFNKGKIEIFFFKKKQLIWMGNPNKFKHKLNAAKMEKKTSKLTTINKHLLTGANSIYGKEISFFFSFGLGINSLCGWTKKNKWW